MSKLFHCAHALLPGGWARDVSIRVDDSGLIESVEVGAPSPPERSVHRLEVVVAGVPNLHSHAFQRAMAGLTEVRVSGDDSFWTWRDTMYHFVERIEPDHLADIAAFAYMQMLEAGFTRVCEFHYLHHDVDGESHDDPAEMAGAIVDAAGRSGIGLSLLPVFYANGGFGGQPAEPAQRRFVTDVDGFGRLHQACESHIRTLPGGVLGIALHSLRAVTPASMDAVLALAGDAPVHIHVSEQRKEVEDCIAWSGLPPVAWLLDHVGLDAQWCLIHATHISDSERDGLAASGAVAGICPLTEANLGDGVFDGVRYLARAGRLGIGSDSNNTISAAGEMAMLEYSQRLRDQHRNRMVNDGSTGRALFDACVAGGAQASGTELGALAPGHSADFVSLDPEHPDLVARDCDSWLDSWIFAAGSAAIDEVWVRGQCQVAGGVHRQRDTLTRRYRSALQRLLR